MFSWVKMKSRSNIISKEEFESEFREKIKNTYGNTQLGWHAHVEQNMYKLSHEALYYISENKDNYFFGQWMVSRAVDLLVFEEIVLKGNDGYQGSSD